MSALKSSKSKNIINSFLLASSIGAYLLRPSVSYSYSHSSDGDNMVLVQQETPAQKQKRISDESAYVVKTLNEVAQGSSFLPKNKLAASDIKTLSLVEERLSRIKKDLSVKQNLEIVAALDKVIGGRPAREIQDIATRIKLMLPSFSDIRSSTSGKKSIVSSKSLPTTISLDAIAGPIEQIQVVTTSKSAQGQCKKIIVGATDLSSYLIADPQSFAKNVADGFCSEYTKDGKSVTLGNVVADALESGIDPKNPNKSLLVRELGDYTSAMDAIRKLRLGDFNYFFSKLPSDSQLREGFAEFLDQRSVVDMTKGRGIFMGTDFNMRLTLQPDILEQWSRSQIIRKPVATTIEAIALGVYLVAGAVEEYTTESTTMGGTSSGVGPTKTGNYTIGNVKLAYLRPYADVDTLIGVSPELTLRLKTRISTSGVVVEGTPLVKKGFNVKEGFQKELVPGLVGSFERLSVGTYAINKGISEDKDFYRPTQKVFFTTTFVLKFDKEGALKDFALKLTPLGTLTEEGFLAGGKVSAELPFNISRSARLTVSVDSLLAKKLTGSSDTSRIPEILTVGGGLGVKLKGGKGEERQGAYINATGSYSKVGDTQNILLMLNLGFDLRNLLE